jgi:hexosaminidase
MLDILNPCWIWKDADLTNGAKLTVTVGQLPFNFQLGNKLDPLPVRPPSRPEGELEVRFGCKGPRLATVPLTEAARNSGLTELQVDVPGAAWATSASPSPAGRSNRCGPCTASGFP